MYKRQVNTLLHTGDIYDVSVLDAERERIAAYLKERGYYNFSVNNISYACLLYTSCGFSARVFPGQGSN